MSTPFRALYPLAQREVYGPNQLVDFTIAFDGEQIVMNSIALVGKVKIVDGQGDVPNPDQGVGRDAEVGHHAYFSTITTSSTSKGLIESFTNYPRYIKAHALATMDSVGIACETRTACEGRTANVQQAMAYIYAGGQEQGHPAEALYESFCIKPRICVNLTGGDLRSDVFGQLMLKFQTAPVRQVLYGDGMSDPQGNYTYQLTELQLIYQTVPLAQGEPQPITMQTYTCVPMQIASNDTNLSCYVPSGITDAVHIACISEADEADATANFLRCAAPPALPVLQEDGTAVVNGFGFSRVRWGINDTTSAIVGFTMESTEEVLWNALRSFVAEPDRFGITMAKLRNYGDIREKTQSEGNGEGYLVGLAFGGLINLGSNKFSVTLESRVTADAPYKAYLYFRSVMQM